MVAKFKVNVKKHGGVQLWKTTSNSDITGNIRSKNASDKNSCYDDLSGAVYGIYGNQECTAEVGKIYINKEETDTSVNFVGRTAENPFEAGVGNKYYVKEITPPTSGSYGLDQRVGTVSIDKATEKGEGWNEVVWQVMEQKAQQQLQKTPPKTTL